MMNIGCHLLWSIKLRGQIKSCYHLLCVHHLDMRKSFIYHYYIISIVCATYIIPIYQYDSNCTKNCISMFFVAIDCGSTPAQHTNLTVTVELEYTGYLDTMNYTCDEGHYFPDNESLHISSCLAEERWSIQTDQTCERQYSKLISDQIAIL